MAQKFELVDQHGNPISSFRSALEVTNSEGKARGGRLFHQTTTPLGLAMVVFTATALVGSLPMWNPTGSGVVVIPKRYIAARVSGTTAFAAFGLMKRNGMGAVVSTGHLVTAFADTDPLNGRGGAVNGVAGGGGGAQSKIRSSNAGTITVVAAAAAHFVRTIGYMQPEIDTTATGINVINHPFEDEIEIYPGEMCWIAATKASVALFSQTMVWEERDLNA